MFLSNFFVVLLMSVLILVYSSPHKVPGQPDDHHHHESENRQASTTPSTTSTTKCPKGKQIKGEDQDTVFPDCDYGEDGNKGDNVDSSEVIDNRIDEEEIHQNITSQPMSTTIQNIASTQTPTEIITELGPTIRPLGCTTLPNPGECRGAFPRFYYNAKIDQCDCFLYGGCDPQLVEFTWLTLNECVNTCNPSKITRGPGCQQITLEEVVRFISTTAHPEKQLQQ